MKMAPSSKHIFLVVFALFAIASLQPSAAVRDTQVFKPTVAADAVRHEAPEIVNAADVTQPSTLLPPLPPIPSIQIPPLPPLPSIPSFQIPTLPPLPPIPNFQIPTLPPLPPIPSFQIPTLPPLPPIPSLQIPTLPPLPPIPSFQIPTLPPLPPVPTIQVPLLPPLPPLPTIQIPPLPQIPTTPGSPGSSQSALEAPTMPQPTECLSSLMDLMPCMEYLITNAVTAPSSICCDGFKTIVEKAPICLCHGINGNVNKFMPAPIDFMRMMTLPATCGVNPPQALAKCSTGPVPPLMPAPAPAPTPAAAQSPGPSANTQKASLAIETMKMAPSSKHILVVFALFAIASLQPSAAVRDTQVFKPTVAVNDVRQEAPEIISAADVTQPSTLLPPLPPIPSIQIPPLPPLPSIPSIQIPTLPPLPPIPSFQIPTLPPLPPIPSFQIPTLPPLPQIPSFHIPTLPPLPPIPSIQIPALAPLPPVPTIQIPPLPPFPSLPTIQIPPLPQVPATTPGVPAAPILAVTSSQSAVMTPTISQPTECLSPLMDLMPCVEYLITDTMTAPPSICCDGFKALVEKAPICLCYGINGNINKLMPMPIDFMRMMSLPATCGVNPPEALAKCSTGPVPPLMPGPAPTAAPSPGPSA
uniref:Bifunctional inhibitor/plant lipid transfer protein/seed storage helical domain-containing protein n=1 Tax=Leersia perrieri TaxID=77586 RepID=A0A0D9WYQ2_9ORYZ